MSSAHEDSASATMVNVPPLENLLATRSQVEKDLALLTESFGQLKAAQQNFSTSLQSLTAISSGEAMKSPSMIPLTSSVYVDGILEDTERVMIDIGTGYYIEQSANSAKGYYKRKIDFIQEQLNKLAPVVQEKRSMIQVLTQFAQQKLQERQAATEQQKSQ